MDNPIDGETPLAVIMNLAKEDLIYKKTLSSMAKDNGIQADMDYSAIKSSMEEENASRSRKGTSGEVTYGLSSYTEESYYQYAYSELEAELMEKLKKNRHFPRRSCKQPTVNVRMSIAMIQG